MAQVVSFDGFKQLIQTKKDKLFVEYIKHCRETVCKIISGGKEIDIPYKNRWEKSYRNGVLAKFYQLNMWAKRHKVQFGMLSLTTAQKGYTTIETIERLSKSWDKFFDNIRKRGYIVFKLFEPHESGEPHIHALIIGDMSKEDIAYMEYLWVEKYEMGDNIVDKDGKQHAFDFSNDLKKCIGNLVNYLMKYLSKTILTDLLNNPSLIKFHSSFWISSKRMFSCSRYLSFVMGKRKEEPKIIVDKLIFGSQIVYDRSISVVVPRKHQQISKGKIEQSLRYYNSILLSKGFNPGDLLYLPDIEGNYMEKPQLKKNSYHVQYKILPFEIKLNRDRYLDNCDIS